MGFFQSIQTLFSNNNRQIEIIVVGLDNSGKTTIINHLKPLNAQSLNITPTVGYNIERFTAANMIFSAYDMSGLTQYRNFWETQYKNIHGILFVVDSSDCLRFAIARDELWMLLNHKNLATRKIPLLILANKSDLKDSVNLSEMHSNLGLDLIRNRSWNIMKTCALTGEGLSTGIEWLSNNIKNYLLNPE